MKKAEDVISYLKSLESEIRRTYQHATLQKEQLFYESRYIFLREIIIELEAKLREAK